MRDGARARGLPRVLAAQRCFARQASPKNLPVVAEGSTAGVEPRHARFVITTDWDSLVSPDSSLVSRRDALARREGHLNRHA